ncbi:hypothetical protein Slala01_70660 [Streptomyces lavendulae subsp. lavendulae]|nr:hypothetical protein Slala01_70660 [Streptomyces lavendulae subsp. lavendulae]
MQRYRRTGLGKRCGALVASVGLLGACTSGSTEPQVPYWMDGVTVASVARHVQVELPGTATGAKAAHQRAHDDMLLLSFVLPTAEVDGFVDGLKPERPLRPGTPFAGEGKLFDRLGLPEPASAPGVRETQVCAPCLARDLDFLQLAVVRVDERSTRLYFRAID